MGIASFSPTGLLGSFQGSLQTSFLGACLGWVGRHTASAPHSSSRPPSAPPAQALRPATAWSPTCPQPPGRPACSAPTPAATRRPVRVLRVIETPPTTASAGRMRISGRMADVCAELDRLAALEAMPRSGSLLQ